MQSLAIDARMIHASGIGVYLKHIIPILSSQFEVSLLGKEEELKEMNWAPNIKTIPSYSGIYTLKEQVELSLKIPSCDAFWSPHYNIPLLPIRAKKRVVTIHDTYHLAYQHTLPLSQKVYANVLLNAAVRLSDKVVTISEFSRQEIRKFTNCPNSKLNVIHRCVDHSMFHADISEDEQKTLRTSLPNLPDKYILFVGNVKPHKNLITLLRGYALLSPEVRKQYGLVIVGKKEGFITGDQEVSKFLRQETSLEQQIQFTGFVPDALLPFLYKCASLFVFPSLYEGFGLPPLEAMACGCPVLASTAASIPEICGDAALYFKPLDVTELSQKLERVLTDEVIRNELVRKGFHQAKEFSWTTSGNQHIQLLKNLLKTV